MPVEVDADELRAAALRLRASARGGLMAHMRRGLIAAGPDLKEAVRDAAKVKMPSGYAPTLLAELQQRLGSRAGASYAAMTMTAWARGNPRDRHVVALDEGNLRHMGWGRRFRPWFDQQIPAGFHTETLTDSAPITRPHLEAALHAALTDAARKG